MRFCKVLLTVLLVGCALTPLVTHAQVFRQRTVSRGSNGYYGKVCIDGVCYLKPCRADCPTGMCQARQAAIDAAYARSNATFRVYGIPSATLIKPTQTVKLEPKPAPRLTLAKDDSILISSTPAQVREMLDLLAITEDSVFVDAGSGEGDLVIAAARRGAIAIGVEINERQYQTLKDRIEAEHLTGRAFAVLGDATEFDYSKATAVSIYQFPELMNRILREVPPSVKVCSNGHWFLGSTRFDSEAGSFYVREVQHE